LWIAKTGFDNNGGNYYIDKNGVKMPTSKNFAARVMVATGNLPPYSDDFLDKRRNVLKDIFRVNQLIQSDDFFKNFFQQIYVSSVGDILLVPLVGDQKIVLGSVAHLDSKFNRLKTFYQKGMPYVGWNKYRTINLKYNGQVVCKK
jgi:cell division protein FtsQ